MIKILRQCAFVLCVLAFSISTAFATTSQAYLVRVKLARYFPPSIPSVSITSDSDFTFADESGSVILQGMASTTCTVSNSADGEVSVSSNSASGDSEESESGSSAEGSYLTIHSAAPIGITSPRDNTIHYYRGDVVIGPGLILINVVPIEDYLKGVLAPEIGPNAPAEALKAQAVASRTYTVKNMNKMSALGADMDDTTRTQSYIGVAGETAPVVSAVDDTSGQVLTYNGQLIDAVFSTDCGGMTADGGPTRPYLSPVTDQECAAAPAWKVIIQQSVLSEVLGSRYRLSGSPVSLSIADTDQSGRVNELQASQDGNRQSITGERLRQLVGYDKLRSTLFAIKDIGDGEYEIDGRGWGHGLGLCQKGTIVLAKQGAVYTDILKHYYTGTTIEELDYALVVTSTVTGVATATPSTSTPTAP